MTSIQDLVEKIKGKVAEHRPNLRVIPDDLFLGLIIILVAFGSFGLGRLSKIEDSKIPVRFENVPTATTRDMLVASATNAVNNQLVGSKNGTKYYYSWCSGVQKISQSNLIYFTSKTDAETRGYTPSATCKGL